MSRKIIDNSVDVKDVGDLVSGSKKVTIDCGVIEMDGLKLNQIMKAAHAAGLRNFKLINVCGQTLIGTGVQGPINIEVHGLMGNHAAAFVDRATINSYPTTFNNGVACPGDAQVAIANTSNPIEFNIGGSVDDLFASYSPSGMFRVAGQGGNRSGLRAGAGVPTIWREIDFNLYHDMSKKERVEDMLYKYQKRRAVLIKKGWGEFLKDFQVKVENRKPPVIMFGRSVRDYFMEYAQGTIGIVLNIANVDFPAGYYTCSGMTAGKAYIRGALELTHLGERVRFSEIDDSDKTFLAKEIKQFFDTFNNRLSEQYQKELDQFINELEKDSTRLISQFKKIIPS
ncbi:MAG: hypothetical protein ACN4E2_01305 [Nitrospinota bacterium]